MADNNSASSWDDAPAGEGYRPYRIEIETAEFVIKTKKDGTPVQLGDSGVGLMALELSGPTMLLDRDDLSDDEEADTPDDADFPVRTFDVGTFEEFQDEDENGQSVTAMKTVGMPRKSWELGQVLMSLKELVGRDWLDGNFGEWTEAESWVGRTLILQKEYVLDKDGNVIKNKNDYARTFTRVLSIDGHDADDKKKKKKKK